MCDMSRGPQGIVEDVLEQLDELVERPEVVAAARAQSRQAMLAWFAEHGISSEQVNEDFIRGGLTACALIFVRQNHAFERQPLLGVADLMAQFLELGVGQTTATAAELETWLEDTGDSTH